MPNEFIHDVVCDEDLQVKQHAYFDAEVDNGDSGASKAIDWTAGNKQRITLTADCTLTFTAPAGACNLVLRIIQDGTGGHTPTFPAATEWVGRVLPEWSTAAGAKDIVTLYYDGSVFSAAALEDVGTVP